MADERYIIDVILQARNEVGRAIAEATGELEAFEKRADAAQRKLDGGFDDSNLGSFRDTLRALSTDIDQFGTKGERLGKTMNEIGKERHLKIRPDVDLGQMTIDMGQLSLSSDKARLSLEKMQARLAAMGKEDDKGNIKKDIKSLERYAAQAKISDAEAQKLWDNTRAAILRNVNTLELNRRKMDELGIAMKEANAKMSDRSGPNRLELAWAEVAGKIRNVVKATEEADRERERTANKELARLKHQIETMENRDTAEEKAALTRDLTDRLRAERMQRLGALEDEIFQKSKRLEGMKLGDPDEIDRQLKGLDQVVERMERIGGTKGAERATARIRIAVDNLKPTEDDFDRLDKKLEKLAHVTIKPEINDRDRRIAEEELRKFAEFAKRVGMTDVDVRVNVHKADALDALERVEAEKMLAAVQEKRRQEEKAQQESDNADRAAWRRQLAADAAREADLAKQRREAAAAQAAQARDAAKDARDRSRAESEYSKQIQTVARLEKQRHDIEERQAQAQQGRGIISRIRGTEPQVFDEAQLAAFDAQMEHQRNKLLELAAVKAATTKDEHFSVDADVGDAVANLLLMDAVKKKASQAPGDSSGWKAYGMAIKESFENSSGSVAAFDNQLRGLVTLIIGGALQPLLTVVVALAGELVALAGSAVMAGAAIGAGLSAGILEAFPVIGLIIAALARLKGIMDAVQQATLVQQQQHQRSVQGNKQVASATNAVANAQDGLRSANEQLAASHRRVADAQANLSKARFDAARQLQDLIDKERQAELQARGAILTQRDAQEALYAAIGAGKTGDIEQQQLRIDDTQLSTQQAARNAARTREDARKAVAGGVEHMPGVEQAQKQLDDARRGVNQAEEAVAKAKRGIDQARHSANAAGADAMASAGKLDFLLSRMSDSERELYRAIRRLQQAWNTTLETVTDPIIEAFTHVVNGVTKILKDPQVLEAVTGLSQDIGKSISTIFDHLTDPEHLQLFLGFVRDAGKDLPKLVDIALKFADSFLRIGDSGKPILDDLLGIIDHLATKLDHLTSNRSAMGRFFAMAQDHLDAWLAMGGALSQLAWAVLRLAAPEGLNSVKSFTGTIREATKWVNDHQDKVTKFFHQAAQVTGIVAQVMLKLGAEILKTFNPTTVGQFAKFINNVLIPGLGGAVRMLGYIVDAFGVLAATPGIGWLMKFVLEWVIVIAIMAKFKALMSPLISIFTNLGKVIGKNGVTGAVDDLGKKIGQNDLGKKMKGIFDGGAKAAGIMLENVGKLIGKIPLLGGLGKSVEGLGQKWKKTGDQAATAAEEERVASSTGPGRTTYTTGGPRGPSSTGTGTRRPPAEGGGGGGGFFAGGGGGPSRLGRIAGRGGTALGAYFAAQIGADMLGVDTSSGVGKTGMDVAKGAGIGFTLGGPAGAGIGAGLVTIKKELNALKTEATGFSQKDIAPALKRMRDEMTNKQWEKANDTANSIKRMTFEMSPANGDKVRSFLDKAQSQMAPFIKNLDALRKAIGKGISPNDIIDPRKNQNAIGQFQSSLDNMRKYGIDSIKDLRETMTFNVDQINKGLVAGSTSWRTAMVTNFGAGVDAIKKAMEDGTVSTTAGAKEIARVTGREMKFMRDNMDSLSQDGKIRLANNFRDAAAAVGYQSDKIGDLTEAALKRIRKLLDAEFQAVGMSPEEARKLARNRTTPGRQNLDQFGRADEGSAGRAEGGYGDFVGSPGERGHDRGSYKLGRGEVVLNWGQQMLVNAKMRGQDTLNSIMNRVKGWHAGGLGNALGFATGKGASEFDGRPSNVNEHVRKIIELMKSKFPLVVTSTTDHSYLTTSGNVSDHVAGNAVDLSGTPDVMHRAAEYVKSSGLYRRLKQGIHNPNLSINRGESVPISFWGPAVWAQHANHLHLAIVGAIGRLAKGVSGASKAFKAIKSPKIPGGGELGSIAQARVDQFTHIANVLARRANAQSSETDQHDQSNIQTTYHGSLNRVFAKHSAGQGGVSLSPDQVVRIAQSVGLPGRTFEQIAHGESNYQPGVVSSDGGWGLWQMTPRVWGAAALAYLKKLGGIGQMLNPIKNAMMAKFLYNAAGGISPWFGTRYVTASSFAEGGEVPGPLGKAVNIIAHAKEWVVNPSQQSKLAAMAGTSVGKLKGALGFSGGPASYKGGGSLDNAPEYITRMSDVEEERHARTKRPREEEDARHEKAMATLKGKNHADERKAENERHKQRVKELDEQVKGEDKRHDNVMKGIKKEQEAEFKRFQQMTPGQQRMTSIRHGVYALPEAPPLGVEGTVKEIGNVALAMSKMDTKSKDYFKRFNDAIRQLTRDGGLLDTMQTALDRQVENMATARTRSGFGLLKTGGRGVKENVGGKFISVIKNLRGDDPTAGLELEMRDLQTQATGLYRMRGEIVKDQKKNNAVLKRIRGQMSAIRRSGGGISDNERDDYTALQKQAQRAEAGQRDLHERARTTNQKIAQSVADRYAKQEELLAAQLEKGQRGSNLKVKFADWQTSIAKTLGLDMGGSQMQAVSKARIDAMKANEPVLKAGIKEAQNRGDKELADQLTDQLISLNEDIAQSEAQMVQDQVDSVQKAADRRNTWIGLQQRVKSALGDSKGLQGIFAWQIESAQKQIEDLKGPLAQAQAQGNAGLVEQIQDKINDLNASIVEMTAQQLQASIDIVEKQSQRDQAALAIRSRMNDVRERMGDRLGAAQSRTQILRDTGSEILQHRNSLYGLLGQAQAEGNVGVVEQLTDEISDLDTQLSENTQAIKESIAATRTLTTQIITGTRERTGGLLGTAKTVFEGVGQLTGTTNTQDLLKVAQAVGDSLATEGGKLVADIDSAINNGEFSQGANTILASIRDAFQQGPEAFARYLTDHAGEISALEMSLSETDRTSFQGMIDALGNNTTATVDNNNQLKTLAGQNDPQGFTSSSWEMFRVAIFNGLGGLLPQYSMGSSGAVVPASSGNLYGYQSPAASSSTVSPTGSTMLTAADNRSSTDNSKTVINDVDVNITEPTEVADPVQIGSAVAFRLANDPNTR